ncbi:hypothetical protein R1sor_001759 [Riccia sorocarpa]|uniref:DNA/RNA-binding protein Alba-like domain-containing protein n=1 Tax=Riccia sorocarpa TaxID=122646 RepID=A0ABD3GZZ9_9MARC
MNRYKKKDKPRAERPVIGRNEIRVTGQGMMSNYITYATTILQEDSGAEIVLKAMGGAISKSVFIAEIIKRRILGVHQITAIGSINITDVWEPLEEGLVPVELRRQISVIQITLSTKELDKTSPGYQSPISAEHVRPLAEYNRGGSSTRFRSLKRGRGKARGFEGTMPVESSGGFDDGVGRGRGRHRGRARPHGHQSGGRGLGATYPSETGVSAEDVRPNDAETAQHGTGRGESSKVVTTLGVRGQERERGRGRKSRTTGAFQAATKTASCSQQLHDYHICARV